MVVIQLFIQIYSNGLGRFAFSLSQGHLLVQPPEHTRPPGGWGHAGYGQPRLLPGEAVSPIDNMKSPGSLQRLPNRAFDFSAEFRSESGPRFGKSDNNNAERGRRSKLGIPVPRICQVRIQLYPVFFNFALKDGDHSPAERRERFFSLQGIAPRNRIISTTGGQSGQKNKQKGMKDNRFQSN